MATIITLARSVVIPNCAESFLASPVHSFDAPITSLKALPPAMTAVIVPITAVTDLNTLLSCCMDDSSALKLFSISLAVFLAESAALSIAASNLEESPEISYVLLLSVSAISAPQIKKPVIASRRAGETLQKDHPDCLVHFRLVRAQEELHIPSNQRQVDAQADIAANI